MLRTAVGVVLVMVSLTLSGCGASEARAKLQSTNNLKEFALAAINYQVMNGTWPQSLDELKPTIGEAYGEIIANPVTGDNPGYEYVAPAPDAETSSETVIFYQLRDGQRDTSLPAAYMDGSVR